SWPMRQAQQLWVAAGSLARATKDSAVAGASTGAAWARKRLCRTSVCSEAGAARVSVIVAILHPTGTAPGCGCRCRCRGRHDVAQSPRRSHRPVPSSGTFAGRCRQQRTQVLRQRVSGMAAHETGEAGACTIQVAALALLADALQPLLGIV